MTLSNVYYIVRRSETGERTLTESPQKYCMMIDDV